MGVNGDDGQLVGADVGGTFTDLVSLDPGTGTIRVLKFPTTGDPGDAIRDNFRALGVVPSEVGFFSHATTLATNALLTRADLGRTALITNAGFRDVLEIARQRRPELYDLSTRRPPPLVVRKDRFTLDCRVAYSGKELKPVDPAEAESLSKKVAAKRFDSVAICFLHSHVNGAHECLMRDNLRRAGFRGHISISSEVDPEYREFERTSTTVVNAVLSPLMSRYFTRLQATLRAAGVAASVYVMGSDGGASTVRFASERPVVAIESGPAAGVLASKRLASDLSLKRVLTFDMGGTTAKACTVIDGEPDYTGEFEAAGRTHSGRSIRGSGYPVRGRVIDLAEVSAGGGTVAWVDESGALRVGPRSAGSNPGPACYSRGGKEPTVTDANVHLGRLNPTALLGGRMRIRSELATRALGRASSALGQEPSDTAKDILRLVNEAMARAVSLVSVERGRDPRDFSLIAFGGAGPAHACDLAEELGVMDILVPVHAGLFSAYGLLAGEFTRNFLSPAGGTPSSASRAMKSLETLATRELQKEGFSEPSMTMSADVRYKGQSHELTVRFNGASGLKTSYDALHRKLYGYSSPDPIEVVNVRLTATVPRPVPRSPKSLKAVAPGPRQLRHAWISGDSRPVRVLIRETLAPGSRGSGPCIIEEYDSTFVVNKGWRWSTEDWGTRVTR